MKELQGACAHCGAGITFPADRIGLTVPCPHCEQPTELMLSPPELEPTVPRRVAVLAVSGIVVLIAAFVACVFGLKHFQKVAEEKKRHQLPSSSTSHETNSLRSSGSDVPVSLAPSATNRAAP